MYNVLMFVDSGVDDFFALAYALKNPAINVVGVVSAYGNITKEQSVANTAYLLKLAGREDIPIIAGAAGPLSGEPVTFYPEIHGAEGLGPILTDVDFTGMKIYDIDQIIQIVNQYEHDLVIVGVGRLTDLALPFILYGENAYDTVNALYIMGGAFLVPGNVTPEAEANFYGDPIAADSVMEKGKNIYIFPLNVTNKALITPEQIKRITEKNNSPFSLIMKPAFDYYYDSYKRRVPGIEGAPMHDLVVLSALVNPDIVQYISRRVRVEQFGHAKGKSIADFRPTPDEEPEDTLDHIAIEIDVERFREDVMTVFMNHKQK